MLENSKNKPATDEKAEIENIRSRLNLMQVRFSPKAGVERLREQLKEALGTPEEVSDIAERAETLTDANTGFYGEALTSDQYKSREANSLKRVIVSCLNPNKKRLQGDYFDVGNSVDAPKRKYVLFDTEYHVPNIILDFIKEKKCQIFIKGTDEKGREIQKSKEIYEYNVVDLEPLTKEELDKLRTVQAMRNAEAA